MAIPMQVTHVEEFAAAAAAAPAMAPEAAQFGQWGVPSAIVAEQQDELNMVYGRCCVR